ncbi:MAG: molybdopterin guanine dinucleotide synthesis [Pseudomonadota bacterium]
MKPDRIVIVDWSASAKPSPARPSADAIWIGVADVAGGTITSSYHRTRADAFATLQTMVQQALHDNQRLLIGADFPFAYPAGFAAALTGARRALALWDWLARHVEDAPDNANNRFALADAINASLPGTGPFWGRPAHLTLPHLPDKGRARHGHGLAERRVVERLVPSAQTCWKLYTTGSVGSQALLGIPMLARLRSTFAGQVAVWPFEPWQKAPVVLAEVYPSLLASQVRALTGPVPATKSGWPIKDAVQVRLLAGALAQMVRDGRLASLLDPPAAPHILTEEGWILGAGHEAGLQTAAAAIGPAALPANP